MKMAKIIVFLVCTLIFNTPRIAWSSVSTPEEAFTMGANWLADKAGAAASQKSLGRVDDVVPLMYNNEAVAYLVPINGVGWAVVSRLKELGTVVAYSTESAPPRDLNHIAIRRNVGDLWVGMEEFRQRYGSVEAVVESGLSADQKMMVDRWNGENLGITKSLEDAEPLLTSQWNQFSPFNDLCPTFVGQSTYAGCVAVAMAQIMYYYKEPVYGQGYHSYSWPRVPLQTLSANFSDDYDWRSMQNSVTTSSPVAAREAVAELVYEAGVSVDMNYGAIGTPDGSTAATNRVAFALVSYFRYQDKIGTRYRRDYTDAVWYGLIKAEIDAGRPIYYSLDPIVPDGRHAAVCDGYRTDSGGEWFHINYGWTDLGATDWYQIDHIGESMEDDVCLVLIEPNGWRTPANPDLYVIDALCAGWGDYNGDGYPDLYVGEVPGKLFENNGNGGLVLAQVQPSISYMNGCAWAEVTGDNCDDLLVAGSGVAVLRGAAEGWFGVYQAVFDFDPGASRSCTWGDFNSDGLLDIAVGTENFGVVLYEAADATGMNYSRVVSPLSVGWAECVSLVHIDQDSYLDLAVSVGELGTVVYRGDGVGGFIEVTGTGLGQWSSTHSWGDIDNDGDLDLFVGGMGLGNQLYRNLGNMVFEDITTASLEYTYSAVTNGGAFADIDNDGDLDLYLVNSGVLSANAPNGMFVNDGTGLFEEDDLFGSAVSSDGASDAVAFADYDLDGDLDFYSDGWNASPDVSRFFVNDFSNNSNTVRVELVGTQSNRLGIGSKVIVDSGSGEVYRYIQGSSTGTCQNYCGSTIVGVMGESYDSISVEWPSGQVSVRPGGFVPATLEIVELDISSVGENLGRKGTITLSPNPFNPAIEMSIEVGGRDHVSADIYDLRGHLIRRYESMAVVGGVASANWDGRDEQGRIVESGVYLVRMRLGDQNYLRKISLVR